MPHTSATARRAYSAQPRQRYAEHRRNAARRAIPFLLTFDQWWAWWQEDGRWERRGRHTGALVMARYGDTGPYAVGNIYAATPRQNIAEAAALHLVADPDFYRKIGSQSAATYYASGRIHHTKDRPNHHRRRPIVTPDGHFPSLALAADHYGIAPNAALKRAQRGWKGWRYADETPADCGNRHFSDALAL
jgi:hypothetical protein